MYIRGFGPPQSSLGGYGRSYGSTGYGATDSVWSSLLTQGFSTAGNMIEAEQQKRLAQQTSEIRQRELQAQAALERVKAEIEAAKASQRKALIPLVGVLAVAAVIGAVAWKVAA